MSTTPSGEPAGKSTLEQLLCVAEGDSFGHGRRQLRQPGPVFGHDAAVAVPALADPGVGAEQEAVGIALEQPLPFRQQFYQWVF